MREDRPSLRSWPLLRRISVLLSFALVLGSQEGCLGGAAKGVGKPCDVDYPASGDPPPNVVTVNPLANECPSGICLRPAMERTTNTGPFCTALCDGDDDCANGERQQPGVAADRRCHGGFVCRRILPGLESNPLACRRVCVCRDFLRTDDTGTNNAQGCSGDSVVGS